MAERTWAGMAIDKEIAARKKLAERVKTADSAERPRVGRHTWSRN